MRRLIDHVRRAREVHRANGERGAVAVMTAVALVVLLLFAALAIDVGLMYEERAQLQSSADAAALAVAQDCAAGSPCLPAAMLTRARQYASANVRDATVDVDQPIKTGNKVKVAVHSLDSDGAAVRPRLTASPQTLSIAMVRAVSRAAWVRLICTLYARPNSMMPSSSTKRIGTTRANSTAAAPRSERHRHMGRSLRVNNAKSQGDLPLAK